MLKEAAREDRLLDVAEENFMSSSPFHAPYRPAKHVYTPIDNHNPSTSIAPQLHPGRVGRGPVLPFPRPLLRCEPPHRHQSVAQVRAAPAQGGSWPAAGQGPLRPCALLACHASRSVTSGRGMPEHGVHAHGRQRGSLAQARGAPLTRPASAAPPVHAVRRRCRALCKHAVWGWLLWIASPRVR